MMADRADILTKGGIDYAGALDRFGGNADLYERLALKFLDDPHFAALEQALLAQDLPLAAREAHSLKGVAGNLSFTHLYEKTCSLSDVLHAEDLETAQVLMASLRTSYTATIEALKATLT